MGKEGESKRGDTAVMHHPSKIRCSPPFTPNDIPLSHPQQQDSLPSFPLPPFRPQTSSSSTSRDRNKYFVKLLAEINIKKILYENGFEGVPLSEKQKEIKKYSLQ